MSRPGGTPVRASEAATSLRASHTTPTSRLGSGWTQGPRTGRQGESASLGVGGMSSGVDLTRQPGLRPARRPLGVRSVALLDEPGRLLVQLGDGGGQLLTGPLALLVEQRDAAEAKRAARRA